jgi:HrpA-like RNA helicase
VNGNLMFEHQKPADLAGIQASFLRLDGRFGKNLQVGCEKTESGDMTTVVVALKRGDLNPEMRRYCQRSPQSDELFGRLFLQRRRVHDGHCPGGKQAPRHPIFGTNAAI